MDSELFFCLNLTVMVKDSKASRGTSKTSAASETRCTEPSWFCLSVANVVLARRRPQLTVCVSGSSSHLVPNRKHEVMRKHCAEQMAAQRRACVCNSSASTADVPTSLSTFSLPAETFACGRKRIKT